MSQMHDPPHPGEILEDTVLRELSVTELANRLSVSRVAPLACRERPRGGERGGLRSGWRRRLAGSAETWMRMQVTYDLWHAQKKRPKIRPIELRQTASLAAGHVIDRRIDSLMRPSLPGQSPLIVRDAVPAFDMIRSTGAGCLRVTSRWGRVSSR